MYTGTFCVVANFILASADYVGFSYTGSTNLSNLSLLTYSRFNGSAHTGRLVILWNLLEAGKHMKKVKCLFIIVSHLLKGPAISDL